MKLNTRFLILALVLMAMVLGACTVTQSRSTELQFVTHLTAGMPEQDVYVVGSDNEVVRATLEELASPEVQAQTVYASTEAVEHDPFGVGESPFGPFAQGQELGFTMGEWLAATGGGSYSIKGENAVADFAYENLIPNGVYTVWCSRINFPPDVQIFDAPCGQWDGSENSFVADSAGNGQITIALKPLPDSTETGVTVFALAYHSDGQTYGAFPGNFGQVTHVQSVAFIPAPSDAAWQANFEPIAMATK